MPWLVVSTALMVLFVLHFDDKLSAFLKKQKREFTPKELNRLSCLAYEQQRRHL